MSLMTSQFKPSRFRIESFGPQLAYNQTYNPRFCYFGSEDYLNDLNDLEQQHFEEQMIELLSEQSIQMQEKEYEKLTVAEKQQINYKKKKQFDSADYYMKQQKCNQQKSIEQQQEEALLIKYAAQGKPPMVKKQKKVFDSADYFLSLYKG